MSRKTSHLANSGHNPSAESPGAPAENTPSSLDKTHRRAQLDVLPACIFEASLAGDCVYVNEFWTKLTGLPQNKALGKKWLEPIHHLDRPYFETQWTKFLEDKNFFNLEFRFAPSEGDVRWCQAQAVAYKDDSGKVVGFVGTMTDISKQKQNALQIALAVDRLNEAQRLAKVGSWELDLLDNRLTWSLEIFRMFEVDPEKFGASYEAFLNAIHPEDRDAVNSAYSNSLVSKKPYEIVHRLQMKDGRIKYVRETCTSYFDKEGKPIRSVGTVQDITDLHKAELELKKYREHLEELIDERTAQLQESEERLLRAQKIAKLGHWFLSSTGTMMWSSEIYQMFGRSQSTFSPSVSNLLHSVPQEDHEAIKNFLKFDNHRKPYQIDHRIKLPNGDIRWLHQEAQLTYDQNGNVTGLTGIAQDITRRKLTEEELLSAKEAAEHANRSKSAFLSRMSHELRTPMNAILGFAQVLNMELESPEQRNYAQEIEVAGDHLLELINELLDLSRIEAGKLSMELRVVNMGKTLNEAIRITQPAIQKYDVTLSADCKSDLLVVADATRLKQVLVNLLTNAAKYNRPGGQVKVNCLASTHTLRIGVSDTGHGISEENLSKLFTPFERLGAEYSSVEGTGVGLALSKQITDLMDGTLTVESKLGEGSTFWLELPRARTQDPEETESEIKRQVEQSKGKTISILYIEDNIANVRVVEAMFKRHPEIRMLVAYDSQEGLDMAKKFTPDIVLLDIHLPGMDGYRVLEILQSDSKTRPIPVVALSADAMPNDIEKGLKSGFRDYITKPVKYDHLFSVIDQIIETKRNTH